VNPEPERGADPAPVESGPWNPGIHSDIPAHWRHLCTILRPENVSTSAAAAGELQLLTGLAAAELVAFRPHRLVLHELLIRVTADLSVPDGSRIEDLGINFREMIGVILRRHLQAQMPNITVAFEQFRERLRAAIDAGFTAVVVRARPSRRAPRNPAPFGFLQRLVARRPEPLPGTTELSWGPGEIAECERMGTEATEELQAAGFRCLARVLSALFTSHGRAWGTRELIVSLATDMACNSHGSDFLGDLIDPTLRDAAVAEGYGLLPAHTGPVVINTKGPSASGKSTLRPLQKDLAGRLGISWSDFALISPDIWRKQLLDYGSLGTAYKYAGAFTSEELQLVDQKLDRYMARKHRRGDMTHLLIDRFRFDSFAPDSAEAGSNLLSRFGQAIYLFFMITPPEQLVERAWKRGLDVGRFKAPDDTLAHSIEAYSGMPDVLFTWVRRTDKTIHFEFLDNSVAYGELPKTVAFGTSSALNVLDIAGMLDIVKFCRVNIHATGPSSLYKDPHLLGAEHNVAFLKRCSQNFHEVNFATQATGRIYLRLTAGDPTFVDREELRGALADYANRTALLAIVPRLLKDAKPGAEPAQYLPGRAEKSRAPPTVGQWGSCAATPGARVR
jgi:hypothetical protein